MAEQQQEFLTVPDIAKLLKIDRHTVADIFAREPGTVILGNKETVRGHRRYRHLRVPLAVFNRVLARSSVRA